MSRRLSLLAGWKGYAAAGFVSALLAAGATFYVTSLGYRLAVAGMQRDQAKAAAQEAQVSLVQFENDTGRIHAAADRFSGIQNMLGQQFGVISRDFHNAIKTHPLPADCVPDVERLRRLTQAVAAANAVVGGQPGPAVPANP
jgi:hypothetical protein